MLPSATQPCESAPEFSVFVQEQQDAVARYVMRRFGGDAHDVVNDVFAIAWQKRASLPVDSTQRRAWLFATARKVIANRVRWRKRLDRFHSQIEPLTASEGGEQSDEQAAVHQALAKLRERDREVLLLIEWDGLSIAEAAQVLAVPESTVTSRIRAARRSFRQAYEALTTASPV